MSSFLGKIKGFFIKAKSKKVLFLLFLFVFINFVLLLEPAKAQFIDFRGGFVGAITDILLGISSLFIKVTVWISQLFIVIASYNNFINSKAVILGWVLVRDVVNMFFVLILLVIAFGTVLGLEQYEWKKLLVKLVFAAVLVNFSRLICGVIIDAAQVFMMTFVNGFAATAGGNVINGLNLNKIYNLSVNANPKNITSDTDMLVTGVAAVFFGSISMFVLGAYLIVMLARVVSLWVLIVLSPIAFISSVLPATQKYASEWWKEFNNNVLAGPLLAFFFWLSFAIVGGGDSFQEVLPTDAAKKYETNALFGSTATGVAQAMDWGAMASFAIAIALLITGVKKTQELGVQGAGMLSSALSTAKKVGMYASGAKLAGWVGQKTWGGIKTQATKIGGDLKDQAQLRGLAFLERSYDKEITTDKKGFWARRADSWMEGEKLRAARKKQIDIRKGILDSQVGTGATFEAKKETEFLKYNLQKREELKQAGMPAILQEVEGKYRQDDTHKKFIENLNTKKREAAQINIEREQLEKEEQRESENKWREGVAGKRSEKMKPVEEKAAELEKQAKELEEQNVFKKDLDEEKERIKTFKDAMEEIIKKIDDVEKEDWGDEDAKKTYMKNLEEDFDRLREAESEAETRKEFLEKESEKKAQSLKVEAENLKIKAGEVRKEGRKKVDESIAGEDKEFARRRKIAGKGIELDDAELRKQQEELREKGDAYQRSGDLARGNAMEAAADNLANKKDAEVFGGMNSTQSKATERMLVSEIGKIEEAMKKTTDKSSTSYKELEKTLNKLQRGKAALASYNASVNGENSRDARTACLNETEFFQKEGEINMENRDRAVLTHLLGSYVGKDGEKEGQEKLRGRFKTEGEFQSFLGTLADNFKKAAMSGDFTGAGLISEEVDKTTGKLKYAWREKPDNDFSYYIQRGKTDKLSTLGNTNKDGVMCGINDESLKHIDALFKGKTDVNLAHKDFNTIFASINEAVVNRNNYAQFEKLINTIKESTKQDAKTKIAVEQRLKALTDKITKARRS